MYEEADCIPEWDGIICWPRSRAGQLVSVLCPEYIYDFNHRGGAAQETWTRKNNTALTWCGGAKLSSYWRLSWNTNIQFSLFVEPIFTNSKFPLECFTICTHSHPWPLTSHGIRNNSQTTLQGGKSEEHLRREQRRIPLQDGQVS